MPARLPDTFSLLREELRRGSCEARGPEVSPGRVAGAIFLGLAAGALPPWSLWVAVALLASVWFGLDGLLACAASIADAPWLVPGVRAAEVRVAAALGGSAATPWMGAVVAGLALGSIGAAFAYAVTRALGLRALRAPYRLPDGAPPWVQAVERVAERYANPRSQRALDRVLFHRIRCKLLADPVGRLVADLAAEVPGGLGSVLDIGTGRGQLALVLLELGRASRVVGVDWDRGKVEQGVRAAARAGLPPLEASFVVGDARTATLEPADTVLLVDLVHYFSKDEQDLILDRAAAAVCPGGRILVRDADPRRGLRSWATWIEEQFFASLRFNVGERVRFRPAPEIVKRLEASGLSCGTLEAWGKTPFSNVLVVGTRGQARPD